MDSFWSTKDERRAAYFTREGPHGPKDLAKQKAFDESTGEQCLWVWAETVGSTSMAMQYFVSSYPAFERAYWASPCRRAYEVIWAHLPCKMYFDLEFPRIPDNADVCLDVLIPTLVRFLYETLHELFPTRRWEVDDVLRLDANTPTKVSTHLIFPSLVWQTQSDLIRFMRGPFAERWARGMHEHWSVFARDGSVASIVDMGVYSRDRNFRMPLSEKPRKNNPLLFVHDRTSVENFRRALITLFPRGSEVQGLTFGEERIVTTIDDVVDVPEEHYRWILRHFLSLHKGKTWKRAQWKHFLTIKLYPGVFCLFKGRAHVSNGTWIRINVLRGDYVYRCMDPTCRANAHRGEYWQANLFEHFRHYWRNGPQAPPERIRRAPRMRE